MASSGKLRRVALVRTDVSEELSTSFIRETRIGELGTTLAVTSNRRTLRRNTKMAASFSIYMFIFRIRTQSHDYLVTINESYLELSCKNVPTARKKA
jgi:hypothetical protein